MLMPLPSFILASTSAIRKKILDQAGLVYECVKPLQEEPRASANISPTEYVLSCARQKALEVSQHHPDRIVVGCDQTVYFESAILNKVNTLEECVQRLVFFSNKSHQLVNGLSCFLDQKEIFSYTEVVTLTLHEFTEEQIRTYVAKEQPLSSVACYFLEGNGIQLIQKLEGNFFTALGLPLLALIQFLRNYQKENSNDHNILCETK